MSIQSEITRITAARDAAFTAIENKGVTVDPDSTIDDMADLINLIETGSGGGSVVIEDETDTHGGTIRTITATNTVKVQRKSATPTTSQQTISPDQNYIGLSQVTVNAIPSNFGDVTSDTATSGDILSGVKAHTNVNGVATQITGSLEIHTYYTGTTIPASGTGSNGDIYLMIPEV